MKKFHTKKRLFGWVLSLAAILLFSFRSEWKSRESIKAPIDDTVKFSPDTVNGWGTYSSYLEDLGDSIEFELILFRDVPANTDWNDSVVVGTIDSSFAPLETRSFEVMELPRTWKVTIQTTGQCSFQLIDGSPPEGDRIILPVITKYQK